MKHGDGVFETRGRETRGRSFCFVFPILIQVVEELGDEVNGPYSKLAIVEIDSNLYRIDEYDGAESVITPEMDKNSYIEIIPKKGLQ